MLNQSDLNMFTGSETIYKHNFFRSFVYTEGVRHVAQSAGAYWLIDAIASHQMSPEIITNPELQEFQVWRLVVLGGKGILACFDGNSDKPVVTQDIPWTDFPLEKIEFYLEPTWIDGITKKVLMLPSER